MIDALQKAFSANRDLTSAKKQSDYLKGHFPFFGLPKPKRAEIELSVFKQFPVKNEKELQNLLTQLWKKEEREFHYAALSLARRNRKYYTPKIFDTLEKMIRNKSWWDTVDDLASNHIGFLLQKFPELIQKMDAWNKDPHLWIRRTSLIYQLKWKEKTDEKKLFQLCHNLKDEKDFFIRKAIGWCLREYSKTNAKAVRSCLEKTTFSPLSMREASKYIFL